MISPQVLQEFYASAIRERHGRARALTPTDAQAVVTRLSSRVACETNAALVQQAIRISHRHQLSYWDSAIVAAAQRCGATELLTEDLNPAQVIKG